MDLDFDDQLSEDWISQPRSSAAASLRGTSSPTYSNSHGSVRHLNEVNRSVSGRVGGDRSLPRKQIEPLRERTSSNLNASKQSRPGKASLRSKMDLVGENDSLEGTQDYTADGTIQIDKSPQRKLTESSTTPEWRRRLINGQRALGDQQDLFSPRGIERIFDQPTKSDRGSSSPSPSPKPKKSMLPLPTRPDSRGPRVKSLRQSHEPRERSQLMKMESNQRADSPQGANAAKAQKPRESRLTFLSSAASGQPRRRSRTASGSREERLREDHHPFPQRSSSRSSDSMLDYGRVDEVSAPDGKRIDSGSQRAANPRLFSRSTNFVTTSRGTAKADDSFFLRSLSPISFGEDATTATISRQDLQRDLEAAGRPQSPKSPLKLFAENDSFTSKHLHRRVSQLEENGRPNAARVSGGQDATDADLPLSAGDGSLGPSKERRRVSNFGDGDLDEHPFEPRGSTQTVAALKLSRHGRKVWSGTSDTARESHIDTQVPDAGQNSDREDEQMESPETLAHSDKKRILAPPRQISLAKRRRTSVNASDATGSTSVRPQLEERDRELSFAGKKRKDARYEAQPTSTPEAIALRPRLVAVGQARRQPSQSKALATDPDVDNVGHAEALVARKKSLTTADFFNEANAIMQKIRAQNHPRSSLGSFQPPPSQFSDPGSSFFHEEFTIELLSRPASREGNEYRKQLTPRALDARVVSHLRKFEDKDDLGLEWSTSSRPRSKSLDEDSEIVEQDPPNVRIRERISDAELELESTRNDRLDQPNTHDQARHYSSQSSTVDSIPTGSSRGSAGKATISPDKVSHLINLTMGGMTFDTGKLCWVKQKTRQSLTISEDAGPSEISEDDPLGEIPDLTVNESQEIRTARAQRSLGAPAARVEEVAALDDSLLRNPNMAPDAGQDSSEVSEVQNFTSSGPIIETRASSWGDLPPQPPQYNAFGSVKRSAPAAANAGLNGTVHIMGSVQQNTSRGEVTPMLSTCWEESNSKHNGPYIELQQELAPTSTENLFTAGDGNEVDQHDKLQEISIVRLPEDTNDQSMVRVVESPPGSPTAEQKRHRQLTFSTPQPPGILRSTHVQSTTAHSVGYKEMYLSPLPDFTMNQPDESLNLDMDYVIQRQGLVSVPEIEKNFSLAIEDLVGKITDIEPYEPYWEYMRALNLNGQKLWTLHMLADFCCRIEKLEVSDNELGQLNGAPRSLRVLTVNHNRLSSMTAWAHLPHLQYLDVSYNKICDLNAFACLIHLRELNLEGNEIEDLSGVENFTGLIHLKLGNNFLQKLDFRGLHMPHLKSLDVHGNRIEEVVGLENLESLRDLNLASNQISQFSCTQSAMPKAMRRIDLSCNKLSTFDVSAAPRLDSLLIDHNQVHYVKGLGRNNSIRKFSWRHQSIDVQAHTEGLEYNCSRQTHCLDIAKNRIPIFAPRTPFLNLRRLNLESCGIEALGEDFGLQIPNLRSLNLNDNGLKDLRPLLGIVMLEELHIARNRIARLRLTAKVLQELAPSLVHLDCRDNPLTVGFYPQCRPRVAAIKEKGEQEGRSNPNTNAVKGINQQLVPSKMHEEDDTEYLKRLDEETLLRRRVYEALLLHRCKAMVLWDGLEMEYRCKTDREIMWSRLVDLGVLTKLPS